MKKRSESIGKKYGRLTVVRECSRRGFVQCVCDCGTCMEVSVYSLRSGNTKSCGCLKREAEGKSLRVAHERNRMYGTNVGVIKKNTIRRNNTTGHPGVWYNPKTNLFESYISLHRHKIHLGRYHTYEDALKARLDGEDEYFAPILASIRTETVSV